MNKPKHVAWILSNCVHTGLTYRKYLSYYISLRLDNLRHVKLITEVTFSLAVALYKRCCTTAEIVRIVEHNMSFHFFVRVRAFRRHRSHLHARALGSFRTASFEDSGCRKAPSR